ncbi:YcaO-like family protein [Corynebacterium pseudotuberculosis]|nr:YcaO-like family protein [Corynebacterium pseudotuberculosis PAT10]AEP70857.1 YcaO-like family protein [Corynebacterium pseudotuberculosis 42/02-A]AFF22776.1 YcaO-like family protein [Corynebacterium pseudotuberculosis P54B96]AJC14358.1 YcaO-like family protein [Corynebacterium pseudotuberculosis]AKJ56301.1 YcaO-like family protein [Corynebacterium pseudotuberculosis]
MCSGSACDMISASLLAFTACADTHVSYKTSARRLAGFSTKHAIKILHEAATELGDNSPWAIHMLTGQIFKVPHAVPVTDAGSQRLPLEALDSIVNSALDPVMGALGPGHSDRGWITSVPFSGITRIRTSLCNLDLTWSGQTESLHRSRNIAALEGLERLCCAHSQGRAILSTTITLPGKAVLPEQLGFGRDLLTLNNSLVPNSPREPHMWVEGHSLRTQDSVFLPAECVYYGDVPARRWAITNSSGSAIGCSLADATHAACLELIERDAIISTWVRSIPTLPLLPSAIAELSSLLCRARMLGLRIRLSRTHTDLGFPVVIAGVDDGTTVSLGSACRDSLHAAAVAALNEAWAFYPERRRVHNAGLPAPKRVRSVLDHANQVSLPQWEGQIDRLLGPHEPRPTCVKGNTPTATTALDALIDAGFDPIRVNTTLPEIQKYGLTAVTILVPGLVPIDFGWDRQRAQFMERPAQLCSQATGGIINPVEKTCHPFA